MKHSKWTLPAVLSLLLGVLACELPASTTPMPVDINVLNTTVAQTVVGAQTQSAVPEPAFSHETAAFTSVSELPILTPTIALTETSIFTSTPLVPLISVSTATNCRSGPGKAYDYRGALLVGETVEVLGVDPSGNYWFIHNPDNDGNFCWVWGKYATISGNISNLPVYTPPPTPTASLTPTPTLTPTLTPSFNASLSDMDSCSGRWWVDIKVINTGAVSFKSNSITVRDKGTDTTMTDMSDGFRDIDGCLPSTVVDIIYPGDTYLFSAPAFPHNLAEHDLVVTLTLCSGTGQKGICATKKFEFKP